MKPSKEGFFMLDGFIIIYYLCGVEYINRENKIHTFTLGGDGNILWDGDFFFSRRLFSAETLKTEAVDPSGGPFISVGADMGYIDDSFKGKIVDSFEQTENGYKILIKDGSKTKLKESNMKKIIEKILLWWDFKKRKSIWKL